jgi:polyphosphate kinase 2 (PPK2 family)
MKLKLDLDDFRVPDGKPFRIKKAKTKVKDLYQNDAHYESLIAEFRVEIDELQQKMYAQNHQGLLLIFQAMDAAGKDSTIKHVMSGVNPQGCQVCSFKTPSAEDLDHDFLWRCQRQLPERGRIQGPLEVCPSNPGGLPAAAVCWSGHASRPWPLRSRTLLLQPI